MTVQSAAPATPKAPVKAMWICMILAWVFFILPIPFTVFIAGPLNLAALVLAIVCLVRSRVGQGVLGLIGTTVISGIVYIIGIGSMMGAAAVGMQAQQQRQAAETSRQVAGATDVIKVSAAQLVKDYDANEVAADNKYKGKIVEVQGMIESVGKDIMDNPHVVLSPGGSTFRNVQCGFSKSQADELAALSKGAQATVRGKVDGLMMNVMISGSQLVK